MTTLNLSSTSVTQIEVDGVIIVAVLSSPSTGQDAELRCLAPHLSVTAENAVTTAASALLPASARRHRRGSVPPCEPLTLSGVPGFAAPVVVVAVAAADDPEAIRRAVGQAARAVPDASSLAVADVGEVANSLAALEGAALGGYRYLRYRSGDQSDLRTVTLCSAAESDSTLQEQLEYSRVMVAAVCGARDLVNCSPADLSPAHFAELVQQSAESLPLSVEVLDEVELADGGYGGILAVGQGSSRPPRLVRLTYRPEGAKSHLALVGKGITFDSGGLSLKTGVGMMTMKSDMAGAAAVVEATEAIARLGLPVAVTSYLALAENMPSGTAQRPGDVITMLSGTTVEVLNTDAEGRLVMADALTRTAEDEADLVIDVATLTGAQIVALGYEVSAAMGNDEQARQQVVDAAGRAGELLWPMPLPATLRPSLDSKIADIANIGDRMGGMLTAALFLAEFAPQGVPWVHLDIAGPSFNDGPARDYCPPGGTGVIVRTLVQVAEDLSLR